MASCSCLLFCRNSNHVWKTQPSLVLHKYVFKARLIQTPKTMWYILAKHKKSQGLTFFEDLSPVSVSTDLCSI